MSLRIANGRIRLRNGVVATAPITPAAPADINVGMIGQSNMVHLSDEFGDVHYYITDPLTQRWNGSLSRIGWYDPTGHIAPGTPYSSWGNSSYASGCIHNARGGDGIANFVNKVAAVAKSTVTTYEYAQIGAPIQAWIDNGSNSYWKTFHDAVVASGRPLTHAIWYQGEDSADQSMSAAAYKAYLRQVHDQLLTLAGFTRATASKFYFGVVILGPCIGYASTPEGASGIIRQAVIEYAADPVNVGAYIAASSHDTDLSGSGGDNSIHIGNPSEARLGLRYAKTMNAWATGSGTGSAGPKIISATRNGSTVTVTVQHVGGTLLKDGSGGSGTSAQAFRFFDAGAGGAQIAYTASSITGPNTISFTLASTPSGALTMDHAMANAPYGVTPSLTWIIYDNDTVPGDTLGLPLQPCAAIAVTGN